MQPPYILDLSYAFRHLRLVYYNIYMCIHLYPCFAQEYIHFPLYVSSTHTHIHTSLSSQALNTYMHIQSYDLPLILTTPRVFLYNVHHHAVIRSYPCNHHPKLMVFILCTFVWSFSSHLQILNMYLSTHPFAIILRTQHTYPPVHHVTHHIHAVVAFICTHSFISSHMFCPPSSN